MRIIHRKADHSNQIVVDLRATRWQQRVIITKLSAAIVKDCALVYPGTIDKFKGPRSEKRDIFLRIRRNALQIAKAAKIARRFT